MKHLIKPLLTALLLLCCTVAGAADFNVDGIYYNILSYEDKTVEVKSGSNKYSGAVTIPASITYNSITYSVTSIGWIAFNGCDGLTSIVIPEGVTSIGKWAFHGCWDLTSIEIPSSVTSIGEEAFANCYCLTSIVVDEGNTIYDSRNNCNAIIETASNTLILGCKNTIIPEGVTSIGNSAFAYCEGLTSIEIPSSVTSIGESAFFFCTGLTSIEIPSCVTNIGNYVFYGCYGLTSIEIPNGVTSISESAFYRCFGLTSIEIPSSVTSIGESAFGLCVSLTSIVVDEGNTIYDSRNNCNAIIETASNTLIAGCVNTIIPEGVTSIGGGAFGGCTGLTSIEIPSSVTSIGNSAFCECYGLKSVEIPSSVTSIGNSAFAYCEGLTSIEIPSSVTSIGERAFAHCTGLTSIEIPSSVTSLGEWAFGGCSGLTSIEIPSSVTSIGVGAFRECYGLTSVVSCIAAEDLFAPGDYAFNEIDKDACTLYVPAGAKATYASTDGWKDFKNIVEFKSSYTITYKVDGEVYATDSVAYGATIEPAAEPTKEGHTFSGWSEIPETMPANDVVIEGNFSVNSYLLTYKVDGDVYVSDSIAYGTTITPIAEPTKEGHTFSGWSEIPETMPAYDVVIEGSFSINSYTVTFMVDGIYYNVISEQGKTVEVVKCSKVHNNKLVIPSSVTYEGCTYIVTTIGSFGTIDDCKDITSITIPNSIESIENVNFPSIKELIIEDGETALSANYRVIDIDPDDRFIEGITGGFPDSIESLYLGRNLSYTRYVNFGMAQKYEYSPCGRCASLKKIVIGDKVTSIGDNLFDGCRKLEEITIGNSVTSIGQNAFYNCINLKAVYISDLAAWCNIYYKTYVQSPFISNAEYSYACNPLYYAKKLYLNGELINKKLTLPDNITVVRDATFATVRIDSLIIPNNIREIGPRAFLNDSIKYICIEDGSTQLAFEDSGSMIVNNPPYFSSLETLHIGRPVSNCAFYNNPSLKNVKISTSDLSSSFAQCTALANVEFTDNVKTIGVCFMECTNLKNVKIPNGVTEIQGPAFWGCESLEEIILPASLENIGRSAFVGCVNLKSITSFIPTYQLFSIVDEYGMHVFDGVDKENCILYVPAGAAATYATTDGWKDFKNIVEIKTTYKVTFVVDDKEFTINSVAEGDKIIYPEIPEKEGYTFMWDTNIDIMPSNDITIIGKYVANSYLLTYKIDGNVYASDSIEYGATIEPIEAPTKEGHTFSGWSEIPATMPAKDVLIEGSFSINSYTVTFMVDGELYETVTVEYGAEIELPTPPEKEGYIFTGWIDVPATMPAEDIVIEGRFDVDTTGINAVTLDLEKNEVYNLKGQRITESENLPRGIYIINGRKVLIK